MQNLTVPKNRRPKFDLSFKFIDLINIPYVSGGIILRFNLDHSSDHTPKAPIKDHKASFDWENKIPVRLVVSKDGVLQESILEIDVIHEVPSDGREESIKLGKVRINVSEYVEATRKDEKPIMRRHLLQDSKINAILSVRARNFSLCEIGLTF